jgi:uncharacterized RDD family membrane protein YckC
MSDPTLPPEPPEAQPPVPPPPPAGDYGAPPPPPPPPAYAPPPPPPPAYAAPPQGYAAAPAPGYGPPANVPGNLADWPTRMISGLIDYFVPYVIAIVLFAVSHVLGELAWLAAIVFIIWNKYVEGQTGQGYGKKIAGTRLVRVADGAVIGGGIGIVRWLCHILDGFCLVGYLWPLWDAQRQTFADKIMGTYVVKV